MITPLLPFFLLSSKALKFYLMPNFDFNLRNGNERNSNAMTIKVLL